MSTMDGCCDVCGTRTRYRCKSCQTFYCSRSCQKIGWPLHESACRTGPGLSTTEETEAVISSEIIDPTSQKHIVPQIVESQDIKMATQENDDVYDHESGYSSTEGQCDPGDKDSDGDSNDGDNVGNIPRQKKDDFKFKFKFADEDRCTPCAPAKTTDALTGVIDNEVATLISSLGVSQQDAEVAMKMFGTIDSAAEYLLGSKITGAMVDDALTDSSDEEPPPLVAEPALLPNPNSGLFNLPAADDDELEEKVRLLVECFSVDVSDARTALLRTDRNMDNAANLLMAQSPSIGLTNLESLD